MDKKLEELANKYQIPVNLLKDAINYERTKVVVQKRRKEPILRLIEQYSE